MRHSGRGDGSPKFDLQERTQELFVYFPGISVLNVEQLSLSI